MMTKAEYEAMVKNPGKFEGEPAWTPYFWELVMNGDGETVWDEDTYDNEGEWEKPLYDKFKVNGDDCEVFPELEAYLGKELHVWEDNLGFVYSKLAK